jgi:hypothetical protein
LKTHTKSFILKDKLSLEPVTSPLRKKSKTTFGSLVNDSEEDEEKTYSYETRGREEKSLMQ